jgi:hypothetical protein
MRKMVNPPSVQRQREFITENANILNPKARLDILNLAMLDDPKVVMEMSGTKELSINLDHCKDETIWHIYNIVKNRLDLLSKPAG